MKTMMTTKTKLAYNEDLQDVLVRSNRCLKSWGPDQRPTGRMGETGGWKGTDG